jgi:hypothetical protein
MRGFVSRGLLCFDFLSLVVCIIAFMGAFSYYRDDFGVVL